ncbi:MAG: histidine kinase [Peptococcaceae bacterium BRH_c4b]|nr:MAG: histidine kinase [Peptococcaceae bacterium BRH_c4b]
MTTMNVLVVDDQPGVRFLLDIIIRDSGHRVLTAENGLEALETVRLIKPDLVFMDVRMPLMGGVEALGKIKMISPDTEVVLMTAYVSDETVEMAMKKGAMCCIAKPFDVDEIKLFIYDFYWRFCNQKKLYCSGNIS